MSSHWWSSLLSGQPALALMVPGWLLGGTMQKVPWGIPTVQILDTGAWAPTRSPPAPLAPAAPDSPLGAQLLSSIST